MLSIEAVKARHRGNYTCFAHNRAGISTHSSILAINGLKFEILSIIFLFICNLLNPCSQVLPTMLSFNFGDEELNIDDSVSAVCAITKGDAPMKLWWHFQQEGESFAYNLTTNDGVVISQSNSKVSMLSIESLKARHRGNYTCFAQNRAGSTFQFAYLAING